MNDYIGDFDGGGPVGVDWHGGVGNWGIAKFGDDRRAIVFFHKQSVFNEIKSIHAGRRMYDDVDFVSIQHPGEREQKIDRPLKEEDKRRWPAQWQAYQNNQAQVVEGTPLDLLFASHPGISDNLKSAGITTVEQLANLSATGMQNFGMGAQDYVNYARSYLDHAQKGVGFHEMQKQLADRDQKIKLQEQRIDVLTQQLDTLLKQNSAIIAATPGASAALAAQAAPKAPDTGLPPLPFRMPRVSPDQEVRKKRGPKPKQAQASSSNYVGDNEGSDAA